MRRANGDKAQGDDSDDDEEEEENFSFRSRQVILRYLYAVYTKDKIV